MKLGQFIKSNPKIILTLLGIGISVYLMLAFNLDVRAIAIITLLLGYITNIFVGLTTLVGLVPIIGPLIVKVFTIPFFWLLNGMGYFTSAYAIKKGYGADSDQAMYHLHQNINGGEKKTLIWMIFRK